MDLAEFFRWLFQQTEVRFMVAHILVNVVLAVAAGMYTGEFRLKKLGEFLYRKLAPFVLVYGAVKVAGSSSGLDGLALPVWAIIEATLVADLVENLDRLGIPIPERLAKIVRGDG